MIFLYCVCILSCIDTHHFVYTSLSQTLYPSIISLLVIILYASVCFFKKRIPDFCIVQILAILLSSYMLIHGLMIKDAENYKQGYTICTLLFMVVLSDIIKTGIMDKRHIENGIILISIINIVLLVAQFLGLIQSGNSFFKLTGANENPNTVAIALAISIPFVIQKIMHRKNIYFMTSLLVLVLIFILTLKCRTAIVGTICIIVCYTLKSPKIRQFIKVNAKKQIGIVLFVCITITVATLAAFSYNWKKDSADGRVFIWLRNCEMIANSPWGYGYGKYEVEYNKYQSRYFTNHKEEYDNSNLATASGSAYNDILEHGVQGGVIGSLLYLLFLLLPTYLAYRDRQWTCFIALLSVIVMSMTNSICYSISPWIMTVLTMAIVGSSCRKTVVNNTVRLICALVIIPLSILLLYREIGFVTSQKLLKNYKINDNCSIESIRSLYPAIGTSEAYFKYLAECYERRENYKAADNCYTEARKYTAAPLLLFKSAMCKEKMGNTTSALEIMHDAVCMLPKNFSLKYHLMIMYDRANDKYHARQIAYEIVSTPEKICNESIHFIKDEAAVKLKE